MNETLQVDRLKGSSPYNDTSIVNRCWSGFPCKWRYINVATFNLRDLCNFVCQVWQYSGAWLERLASCLTFMASIRKTWRSPVIRLRALDPVCQLLTSFCVSLTRFCRAAFQLENHWLIAPADLTRPQSEKSLLTFSVRIFILLQFWQKLGSYTFWTTLFSPILWLWIYSELVSDADNMF